MKSHPFYAAHEILLTIRSVFELISAGQRHVFDSFECAIQALAPTCAHCHRRVIEHGIEAGGRFYCSANCARTAGASQVVDRVA